MKKSIITLVALFGTLFAANAQYNYGSQTSTGSVSTGVNTNSIYIHDYMKADGTIVRGHNRSVQNSTNHDNYSTYGNRNPYTGTVGSRAQDYSTGAYNYGTGQTIKTGPRGGQYYINSHGNKTYVPKRR